MDSKTILNRLMDGHMTVDEVIELRELPTVISEEEFNKLTDYQRSHFLGAIVAVDEEILSTLLNS